MIDNFAIAVSHGLILIALWRLLWRPDLDSDNPQEERGWRDPGDA